MAQMSPVQHKFAEKLIILNDRGTGVLTRLYNIRKACQNVKTKPPFLSDKSLESTLKHVVRKFPAIDTKHMQAIGPMCGDIIKSLSPYYHTFVDLLDFRDHVCELLTTMVALQLQLDVTLNFELTHDYLDLVGTYVSLMVLLSRVDDRKAVLALYSGAHELKMGQCEANFPRLGQFIVDFETPMRRLAEEFVPHVPLLLGALQSLGGVFPRRNLSADQWSSGRMLSMTANPTQMLNPAQTDTMACEYLSLEKMERWIVFGCMLCHQSLASRPELLDLLTNALQSSWVLTLYRDEVVHVHHFVQTFFESMRGHSKRVAEVKECHNQALNNAALMHRERRTFLRPALCELGLLLQDQPGLLGPKALFVLMALCFARDEVHWLLRHADNQPAAVGGSSKQRQRIADDLVDRQLPELLFQMEVLRALVRKYQQVLQRYYVQYLAGYDATALSLATQQLQVCCEEQSVILASAYTTISELSVQQLERGAVFNFLGLRLDLYRLQGYSSSSSSGGAASGSLSLIAFRDLSQILNTIIFHSKMVDHTHQVLVEVSDLSIFCFYPAQFDNCFRQCLEFPGQNRYIICFPLICGHFQNCTHELCPEERHHIRERSLSVVNNFLDSMAEEAKNIVTAICDEQCSLSDKLLPKNCASTMVDVVIHKKKKKKKTKAKKETQVVEDRPGMESCRRAREDLQLMDKLDMALSELCFAINYSSAIHVWEHSFAPREYLRQHLEVRFARVLAGMVMYNADTGEISKPTEMLASVQAYLCTLQKVETMVLLDMAGIFSQVLLQQTQMVADNASPAAAGMVGSKAGGNGGAGEKTMAAIYVEWYSEVLLRHVINSCVGSSGSSGSGSGGSSGQVCYIHSQRALVTLEMDATALPLLTEEYTDISELCALCQLIGASAMHALFDATMRLVAVQVSDMRQLVVDNRELLIALRTNFDKPDTMRELGRKLNAAAVDTLLQRLTAVGVLLNFHRLCQRAVRHVLGERVPFLAAAITDLYHHSPLLTGPACQEQQQQQAVVDMERQHVIREMASVAGLPCPIEPLLVSHLRRLTVAASVEDECLNSCLLMVFVAVALPRLARSELSHYAPANGACRNNAHCLAAAVSAVFGALFAMAGHDVEDRLKEFLVLATSALLRLGAETDRDGTRERDSVFQVFRDIVDQSPVLSTDQMELCFPFALLRFSYVALHRGEQLIAPEK